jgi:hypothetical protein
MELLTHCTFCVVLLLREPQILQIIELIDKYGRNWREYVERIKKKRKHLKILTNRRKFGKTSGVMEEFSFVICTTGLNRLTVRKDDDVIFPNEGSINVSSTLVMGDTLFYYYY